MAVIRNCWLALILLLGAAGLMLVVCGMVVALSPELLKNAEANIRNSLAVRAAALQRLNVSMGNENLHLASLVRDPIIVLISFGFLLLLITTLACRGLHTRNVVIVSLFLFLLSAFLLAEVVIVILVYSCPSTIAEMVGPFLQMTLYEDYSGISAENAVTVLWNAAMVHWKCCGFNSYADFELMEKWDKELDLIGLLPQDLDGRAPSCQAAPDYPACHIISQSPGGHPPDDVCHQLWRVWYFLLQHTRQGLLGRRAALGSIPLRSQFSCHHLDNGTDWLERVAQTFHYCICCLSDLNRETHAIKPFILYGSCLQNCRRTAIGRGI